MYFIWDIMMSSVVLENKWENAGMARNVLLSGNIIDLKISVLKIYNSKNEISQYYK